MTEQTPYGDPLSLPFWEAASRKQLVVQRCEACGEHQFYPRPFCLSCYSEDVVWVEVSGRATVYSQTTVEMATPSYVVALVDLEEGPRLVTALEGTRAEIGDAVELRWRDRDDAPPVPVFVKAQP
jgi:uncharacterized OB-fold protein